MGCAIHSGRSTLSGRRIYLYLALVLAVCVAGCTSSTRYATTAAAQHASRDAESEAHRFNASLAVLAAAELGATDYTVGPEDLIEVTLFDIQDREGDPRIVQSRVSNTGFVTLPLVGKVPAAGFTPGDLEHQLRTHYQRFIHDPQITVFVREFRGYEISVVGYVNTPGILQLRGRRTLLEALSMAGGLSEDAGRTIRLTRYTETEVLTQVVDLHQIENDGKVELNPELLPGDVVTVPKAGMFYVEGMVGKAGAYPLLQETTITQAIATAGGPDINLAAEGGTLLLRKAVDGPRETIPVDIGAIYAGRAVDLIVQEDDVIVVPVSGGKLIVDRLLGLVRVGVNAAR